MVLKGKSKDEYINDIRDLMNQADNILSDLTAIHLAASVLPKGAVRDGILANITNAMAKLKAMKGF